jgi:hypothetical protein
MPNLTPGTYQTRNMRIARLTEQFSRPKRLTDGQVITITGYRGDLMKSDGKTVDTPQEWEDTLLSNTLGVIVRAGATEGVASEFDLVRKID